MCEVLKVSESGYYRWLKNRGKPTRRQLLLVEIHKVLEEHPDNDNYGYKRITIALAQRGITVSEQTVRRAMQEGGLLHKCRRPHGITKSDPGAQQCENLVKGDFSAEAPLSKLFTDISEVPCRDGKLYISPIMDAADGEIVALEMHDDMKKELCIDTLKQLKARYGNLPGTILHSDRGSQYTSAAFRAELEKMGMVQSLSGAGRCYDNSRMESFFVTLKKEKLYRIPTTEMTRDEVRTVIFRYIFVYYNRIRIHTSNEYGLPPSLLREYRQLMTEPAA